jgi:organic radical activating enzyme
VHKRNHYANLAEVFSSIQGEGLYVGCRHIFVRVRGCNLHCRYCDTPAASEIGGGCLAEPAPGQKPVVLDNPISADELATIVGDLDQPPGAHHAVAFTGGEPLHKAAYLHNALPLIRKRHLRIYLDTNGTLPEELAGLIDLVDIIAMDIKIPSATGQPAHYEANRRFLAIAAKRDVFVKVIFSEEIADAELDEIAGVVCSVGRPIPVVLQPVTARCGMTLPRPSTVLAAQQKLAARVAEVRVIPQVHPVLRVK